MHAGQRAHSQCRALSMHYASTWYEAWLLFLPIWKGVCTMHLLGMKPSWCSYPSGRECALCIYLVWSLVDVPTHLEGSVHYASTWYEAWLMFLPIWKGVCTMHLLGMKPCWCSYPSGRECALCIYLVWSLVDVPTHLEGSAHYASTWYEAWLMFLPIWKGVRTMHLLGMKPGWCSYPSGRECALCIYLVWSLVDVPTHLEGSAHYASTWYEAWLMFLPIWKGVCTMHLLGMKPGWCSYPSGREYALCIYLIWSLVDVPTHLEGSVHYASTWYEAWLMFLPIWKGVRTMHLLGMKPSWCSYPSGRECSLCIYLVWSLVDVPTHLEGSVHYAYADRCALWRNKSTVLPSKWQKLWHDHLTVSAVANLRLAVRANEYENRRLHRGELIRVRGWVKLRNCNWLWTNFVNWFLI